MIISYTCHSLVIITILMIITILKIITILIIITILMIRIARRNAMRLALTRVRCRGAVTARGRPKLRSKRDSHSKRASKQSKQFSNGSLIYREKTYKLCHNTILDINSLLLLMLFVKKISVTVKDIWVLDSLSDVPHDNIPNTFSSRLPANLRR